MKQSSRLSSQAEFDLAEIWIQIARRNPAAADRQIDAIHATLKLLAKSSRLGERQPQLGSAIRRFVCGQYCIYYQPEDYGIYVVRVIHGARDIQTLTP